MPINNNILNQKGTPAFYSDIFANRPAFGYAGRVFISTDTGAIYEDTGSAWTLIADAGAGTTGTLQQVTTNGNTTTLGIVVDGININNGAGTGTENTAIGKSSLNNNTTGINNTALGSYSLGFNTTGNNNTAIGVNSLITNTTGIQNTAIGTSSLQANTTGQYNTSIGESTLATQTTANNNTAVGSAALTANTTGTPNTAVGRLSLAANTTGGSNTAVGSNSLQANTTASQNTAVGYASLQTNTTGTQNTAIGVTAGNLITTGSNNTIIGNYGGTPTLANNIVLSDGAGNVRLFSDANGLIGINQAVGSTIGGQLDIHTTQTYALVLNGLSTSNAYTAFSNNSVGKWRIGNTYNAGANTFDIFNLGTSSTALSFNSTTNAATFSSSVGVGGTISGNYPLTIRSGVADYTKILDWGTGAGGSWGTMTINISAPYNTIFNSGGFAFTGGNVLIASTTDDTINKLQVNGSGIFNLSSNRNLAIKFDTNITLSAQADSGAPENLRMYADTFRVYTSTTTVGLTERLAISNTGVVTISNLAGTGSRAVLADASGVLSAPVSDISVKENINPIGYGLNEILKMNPVWFDFIDGYKNYGEGRQNGNIAQEMQAIIPEAVFTTPSTGKMGINYDQLHAVYIKAIQEQQAQIEELRKIVATINK